MSMMIGGMNTNSRVVTLKDAEGNVVGRITKTGGNSGNKKPKKLFYNFKQVSARILQAKTSGNARQTVILARGKLASLRQKVKGRGEYDDTELAAAIIHAEKMLRIAKKKQKNLTAEEKAARGKNGGQIDPFESEEEDDVFSMEDILKDNPDINSENFQQRIELLMEQMKQMMEETMHAAEKMNGLDELAEDLMASEENMDPAELELRKKKHRADELKEIIEADMKYLKTIFDKLEREKQSNTGAAKGAHSSAADPGVSLEIAGAQMPVPETAALAEGGNLDVTV